MKDFKRLKGKEGANEEVVVIKKPNLAGGLVLMS